MTCSESPLTSTPPRHEAEAGEAEGEEGEGGGFGDLCRSPQPQSACSRIPGPKLTKKTKVDESSIDTKGAAELRAKKRNIDPSD